MWPRRCESTAGAARRRRGRCSNGCPGLRWDGKWRFFAAIFRWLDAGWVSRHDLMHEQEGLKTKIGI